jgi:hypothetical protein
MGVFLQGDTFVRTIAISLAILALSTPFARAQDYRLEFHSDEALSSCELAVSSPGLIKVHMLVTGQGGPLAGLSFRAIKPACMRSAVWIADVWEQTTVRVYYGTTQNGVDVIPDCPPNTPPFVARYLPVYLGWIWFSVTEPTDPCCIYEPAKKPSDPYMYLIMCSDFGADKPMTAGKLVMNPNDTCRCDLPLATQQSTWGGVKALYR